MPRESETTTIELPNGTKLVFDDSLSFLKLGRRPTHFEVKVYKAACAIPCGKVSTYGDMAKVLKTSSRAVGQALRRNPFAPTVPCHRIVKTDLSIGGFSGTQGHTTEVWQKMNLLAKEGLHFEERSIASSSFVVKHTDLHRLLQ